MKTTTTVAHRLVRRLAALSATLGVVIAGLVLPAAMQAAPAQAAGSGARAVAADFDSQVLHFTNVERRKHGLRPLRIGSCVDRFALRHTATLAKKNRMYHQPLRPVLRSCSRHTAGENLAWRGGSLSAQQVVSMWMNSSGHRANILNPRFRYVGIDAFTSTRSGRVYAGQVFAG